MKKYFIKISVLCSLCSVLSCIACGNANAASIDLDTEDPLYMPVMGDFLTKTGLSYSDDIIKLSERMAYGINNRFSVTGDIHYQEDFDGPEDGFSNFGLGGVYRLSDTCAVGPKILSDVLFGIKFGGNKNVREPEFADTVYYAGLRLGRQWSAMTLAGTIKTSWIFDETRGMAYIDLVPEAYFRLTENWKTGIGADFRIATNPGFDAEWLNFKLLRQYGRTQYVGHVDYEIEGDEWQFGARVNILF